MKRPVVILFIAIFSVMGLLWLLSSRLAIALYRSDLNLRVASYVLSADSVLARDPELDYRGNPSYKRKYISFFGKDRTIEALLSVDSSARLTTPDKGEWLRLYNLLSNPPHSVKLLETWMCDGLKWNILEAYYLDLDYHGATAVSSKIESGYAQEAALFSVIWGKTRSDKEGLDTLVYWSEYVRRTKDSAVARYLLSAVGRSGFGEFIRGRRSEIVEVIGLLPPDSTEVVNFRKRYGNELGSP